jgi:hypothetical protein
MSNTVQNLVNSWNSNASDCFQTKSRFLNRAYHFETSKNCISMFESWVRVRLRSAPASVADSKLVVSDVDLMQLQMRRAVPTLQGPWSQGYTASGRSLTNSLQEFCFITFQKHPWCGILCMLACFVIRYTTISQTECWTTVTTVTFKSPNMLPLPEFWLFALVIALPSSVDYSKLNFLSNVLGKTLSHLSLPSQ